MKSNFAVEVKDEKAITKISNELYNLISTIDKEYKDIIFVCIGTDRSTGDALAPMVGSKLENRYKIYGTMHNPVHAKNLSDTLEKIDMTNNLIIAIDASLGRNENLGKINVFKGSIFPGSGVGKELPPVGDISITGIVNISGFMEYVILQNTRLSFVMDLADVITNSIVKTMKRYNRNLWRKIA